MIKRIKSNKGSTLMVAFLVIVVLSLYGAGFLLVGINEARISERQRRTAIAFNIAEAGLERTLYDLREDFINDPTPSWLDDGINGNPIVPDSNNYYDLVYANNSIGGGTYNIQLKNIAGATNAIWIISTGQFKGVTQSIKTYAKIVNVSPWSNAIFAGAGAAGSLINGNVDIRGSVHILGNGISSNDLVVDLGGTAELIGNNYAGLSATLKAKVPPLPTVEFNSETVETLNAALRVKRGVVGLSGAATAGQPDVFGDEDKETVKGVFVTDGFGGNAGEKNVHSDNGWSSSYDLGDSVTFPSLSDPHGGYNTYQDYLKANALVISDPADLNTFSNITSTSNFSYANANGSISMDGNGNLAISGVVYLEGGSLNMVDKKKTINYTGSGSILATENVLIDVNLLTPGNNSFPTNILAVMTPKTMTIGTLAQINVMGLFYAEQSIIMEKQTVLLGSIVSNYFNLGTNVPSVYQVPDVKDNLPAGLISSDSAWMIKTTGWQTL